MFHAGQEPFNMAELNSEMPCGYDEDFVSPTDEDLQCAICYLALREPVLTRCGHRFCKDCLERHMARYAVRNYHFVTWLCRMPWLPKNLITQKSEGAKKALRSKVFIFVSGVNMAIRTSEYESCSFETELHAILPIRSPLNRPCRSTSLLPLRTSSALSIAWRDLSNHTIISTIQLRPPEREKIKYNIELKISMKILFHYPPTFPFL